ARRPSPAVEPASTTPSQAWKRRRVDAHTMMPDLARPRGLPGDVAGPACWDAPEPRRGWSRRRWSGRGGAAAGPSRGGDRPRARNRRPGRRFSPPGPPRAPLAGRLPCLHGWPEVRVLREFGDLEMAIMEVMWAGDGPYVVREVRERLRYGRPVAYTTVMTVMSILHRKGVLNR